ncbi:uncharacterized protein LOC128730195 [Anopheles nili]|uniref:uncharacterized protein LOC128730195 n=1 Tax=Anopheles nili TaxID=185578 RepID=UPI00237AC4FC|nr:uncharacterized protein LOC128730195 [Anopheles nili]
MCSRLRETTQRQHRPSAAVDRSYQHELLDGKGRMSTAYKHLYSCVTFLIFILVINFYKNRIHVNREREASVRAATKLKRAGALNRPLPLEGTLDDLFVEYGYLNKGRTSAWLWDRSKQYPGRCLDVEVFFVQTLSRSLGQHRAYGPEGLHYRSTVLVENTKKKDTGQTDESVPNSSIYVFLSVLLILVFAAGFDIAKHLTAAKCNSKEDTQRRLSLQNYQALIREKQKQFRMMKQHYSQPSMSIQRSIDESVVPYSGFARKEESSFVGITGIQQPTKEVPAPLLRRQSVPTLMRTQPASVGSAFSTASVVAPFGRRTSVDSFWETDLTAKGVPPPGNGSPPEVRRRVRMLHRH